MVIHTGGYDFLSKLDAHCHTLDCTDVLTFSVMTHCKCCSGAIISVFKQNGYTSNVQNLLCFYNVVWKKLFCSPILHLFDQKYSNFLKYYYSLSPFKYIWYVIGNTLLEGVCVSLTRHMSWIWRRIYACLWQLSLSVILSVMSFLMLQRWHYLT